MFGTTDVYEAHPPPDARILMRGQVVAGMSRADPPADGRKKTSRGVEQGVNDPMMPIVWTREVEGRRVLVCTMGAATDFLDEGLRRLFVNGAHWCVRLPVQPNADVSLVGPYHPSPFGFGKYRKGIRPADLQAEGQSHPTLPIDSH